MCHDVTKTVIAVTFYRVTAMTVTAVTYLGKLCFFSINDCSLPYEMICLLLWIIIGKLINSIFLFFCIILVTSKTVFTVFRLLTDFAYLYIYEFWLALWKIVRSSVILLLPLFTKYYKNPLAFLTKYIFCCSWSFFVVWHILQ